MDFILILPVYRPLHFATILMPNGLHIILEEFAQMIQSIKNVFIDKNTWLFVYTFTPCSGGAGHILYCADK